MLILFPKTDENISKTISSFVNVASTKSFSMSSNIEFLKFTIIAFVEFILLVPLISYNHDISGQYCTFFIPYFWHR